jgi:3-hydroxyisobutyrate dehydrogenase
MNALGFIGLGNMGSALATNLLCAGFHVVVHDAAGPDRNVEGARFVADVAGVAANAEIVVLSLPDGNVSELVAKQLRDATGSRVTHVIDTSTIGPRAARAIEALLAAGDIGYVDAPVSGGAAGARARTLSVMVAASDAAAEHVRPVLHALTDRVKWVGDRPGLAQTIKLANNFLAATALASTSEAVAFGVANGVDMAVMLEVINASSGASAATGDKFPNHVVTETYSSGFSNSLMAKDVRLYVDEVEERGGPASLGRTTLSVWQRFASEQPGADFTRIYPFLSDASRPPPFADGTHSQ